MRKQVNDTRLFKTPFSREYWRLALAELRNPRMLVFAALILALRIALKPFKIPIVADLSEGLGFIVNAFGSMVYGPVVALLSGALSDALGFMLFPSGVYFPPFMITEMAGSFVFALFLYRAEISVPRLLLCRFSICLFVNVILAYPIWLWYYAVALGRPYPIALIRIVKNLALFPVEAVILAVVFRHILPPFRRMGLVRSGSDALRFTKRHAVLLAALVVLGAGTVGGYFVYDYNTKSFSADYTPSERLETNRRMNAAVAARSSLGPEDTLVTVVESARSAVGNPDMTYQLAVYRIDPEAFARNQAQAEADLAAGKEGAKPYNLDTLMGYSKTPASKDDALIRAASAVLVEKKKTGEFVSLELWEEK